MTERTKLQRKMIAALAAGNTEEAKRIDWNIRCLDWIAIQSGERERQPDDAERLKDVFLCFLIKTNRVDK